MDERSFSKIFLLLFLSSCVNVALSQLCDSAGYTLIDEPRRSTKAIYDFEVDDAICDEFLNEVTWIRYTSREGNTTIPEREANDSVPVDRCGTNAPIYIRGLGSHPTVDGTTTVATVCANYGYDTCGWTETIQIHRCPAQGTEDGYFIYKLKSPPGCSLAYCAGEGSPCKREHHWNGTACVDGFPPMTGSPIFEGPYTNGSGYATEVYFSCTVGYSWRPSDDDARFRVTFLFDGEPLETVNISKRTARLLPFILTSDDNMTVSLGEYYLKGRLGRRISCKVESFWEGEEPTNKSTLFSQRQYSVSIQSYSNSYYFYTSNGSTFDVYFYTSIPFTCSHCKPGNKACCRYEFRINSTAASTCYLKWVEGSWYITTTISVLPKQSDSIANYRFLFYPFRGDEVTGGATGSLWRDYVIPPVDIEIIPPNEMYKYCSSTTDPYIGTFDYNYYSLNAVGDFYLTSAKDAAQNMEIQVRVEQCWWGTCNCGVIVREGNSVYKISMCENGPPDTYRTPTVVRLLSQEPVDSSSIYADGTGYFFSVRMPSGLRVEVYASDRLNIYTSLPPEYHGKTDNFTICGNSNGDYYDDYVFNFDDLRIPDHLNYFKTQPQCSSIYNPPLHTCECNNDIHKVQCSDKDPLLNIVSQAHDYLPDRWTSGVVCNKETSPFQFLASNSLSEETDFILGPALLFPPFNYDPNYGKDISYSWPTPKNKTEAEVEAYCSQIFQSSAAYADCSTTTNVSRLVDSCKMDLQRVDEWVPATIYVQVLEEICINVMVAKINSSDVYDNSTYSAVINVRNKMCPNQCSDRGNCVDGNCVCNQGFIGTDCSIEEGAPSTLTGILKGDICDARNRPCEVISVSGRGIASTAALKCRFYNTNTNKYTEAPGTLITGSEYSCPVPSTTTHRRRRRSTEAGSTALTAMSVSVTTDGVKYSNSLPFTVYDSKCLQCSDSSDCKQKTDTCLIQNECVASNEASSTDSCQRCIPTASRSSWTDTTIVGSWQQCSRQCDYGAQSKSVVCGNAVRSTETQLCKSSDCEDKPSENTQGVGVILSQSDLEKILLLPDATLKAFSDAINGYCATNAKVCCESITETHENVKSVTYTSQGLLNYASGYPVLNQANSKLKLIVKIDLPQVVSQCAKTSAQSSSIVFADKTLIYQIVSNERSKIEQNLGVVFTSVWTPGQSDSDDSASDLNKGSMLFILMMIGACAIVLHQ